MLFQETWPLLQQGKCVKVHGADWFLFLLPGIPELWVMSHLAHSPEPFNPTIQDVLSNDWEIVQ